MYKIWAIFKKELKLYFSSPIAYAVYTVFVVITGLFFYMYLFGFINKCMEYDRRAQLMGNMYQMPVMNVNEWVARPLFGTVNIILMFMLPGITMRIFSEEKRNDTMQLLLTSPLSEWHIVLGKYAACLFFYAIMIFLTSFQFAFLFIYGSPEMMPIIAGYVALLLSGAAFVAMGIFVSSQTENQIVAFIVTLAINMFSVISNRLLFWLAIKFTTTKIPNTSSAAVPSPALTRVAFKLKKLLMVANSTTA